MGHGVVAEGPFREGWERDEAEEAEMAERSMWVRGHGVNTDMAEMSRLLKEFGRLKRILTFATPRRSPFGHNVAYVTYYEVNAAHRAVSKLNRDGFNGSPAQSQLEHLGTGAYWSRPAQKAPVVQTRPLPVKATESPEEERRRSSNGSSPGIRRKLEEIRRKREDLSKQVKTASPVPTSEEKHPEDPLPSGAKKETMKEGRSPSKTSRDSPRTRKEEPSSRLGKDNRPSPSSRSLIPLICMVARSTQPRRSRSPLVRKSEVIDRKREERHRREEKEDAVPTKKKETMVPPPKESTGRDHRGEERRLEERRARSRSPLLSRRGQRDEQTRKEDSIVRKDRSSPRDQPRSESLSERKAEEPKRRERTDERIRREEPPVIVSPKVEERPDRNYSPDRRENRREVDMPRNGEVRRPSPPRRDRSKEDVIKRIEPKREEPRAGERATGTSKTWGEERRERRRNMTMEQKKASWKEVERKLPKREESPRRRSPLPLKENGAERRNTNVSATVPKNEEKPKMREQEERRRERRRTPSPRRESDRIEESVKTERSSQGGRSLQRPLKDHIGKQANGTPKKDQPWRKEEPAKEVAEGKKEEKKPPPATRGQETQRRIIVPVSTERRRRPFEGKEEPEVKRTEEGRGLMKRKEEGLCFVSREKRGRVRGPRTPEYESLQPEDMKNTLLLQNLNVSREQVPIWFDGNGDPDFEGLNFLSQSALNDSR